MLLDGTDVGVGAEENVLQLRLLLVHFFDGFATVWCGGWDVGIVAAL